jgi:hypothetical protein
MGHLQRTRREYNRTVFDALLVHDGRIEAQFSPIFAGVFGEVWRSFVASLVDELQTGAYSNLSDVRDRLGELARAAGWAAV